MSDDTGAGLPSSPRVATGNMNTMRKRLKRKAGSDVSMGSQVESLGILSATGAHNQIHIITAPMTDGPSDAAQAEWEAAADNAKYPQATQVGENGVFQDMPVFDFFDDTSDGSSASSRLQDVAMDGTPSRTVRASTNGYTVDFINRHARFVGFAVNPNYKDDGTGFHDNLTVHAQGLRTALNTSSKPIFAGQFITYVAPELVPVSESKKGVVKYAPAVAYAGVASRNMQFFELQPRAVEPRETCGILDNAVEKIAAVSSFHRLDRSTQDALSVSERKEDGKFNWAKHFGGRKAAVREVVDKQTKDLERQGMPWSAEIAAFLASLGDLYTATLAQTSELIEQGGIDTFSIAAAGMQSLQAFMGAWERTDLAKLEKDEHDTSSKDRKHFSQIKKAVENQMIAVRTEYNRLTDDELFNSKHRDKAEWPMSQLSTFAGYSVRMIQLGIHIAMRDLGRIHGKVVKGGAQGKGIDVQTYG